MAMMTSSAAAMFPVEWDSGDKLDGGAGNDLIAGDNAFICRRVDGLCPWVQALTGTYLYGDSLMEDRMGKP